MIEKTMASLPVDFRLFQFPSSTFASGKKGRVSAGGSRLVSFFIERFFAYHGLFRFAFYSTYLPSYRSTRLFVFLPHFASTSALQRIKKGSVEIQKNLLFRSVSYRVHFYTWNSTKMDVDSAQMFLDRGYLKYLSFSLYIYLNNKLK